jgi:hypothetical protein
MAILCRQDTVKNELCVPFQKAPVCHITLRGSYYWPTSIPCADSLAKMYYVDNTYTRQVFEIVSEAYEKCRNISAKVFPQPFLMSLLRGAMSCTSYRIAKGCVIGLQWKIIRFRGSYREEMLICARIICTVLKGLSASPLMEDKPPLQRH